MNCNCNSGMPVRTPVPMFEQPPVPMHRADSCGPMDRTGMERFPVGMGYVPIQGWETPYPLERALMRGTIFPSLDYPFMMGRCRGWQR